MQETSLHPNHSIHAYQTRFDLLDTWQTRTGTILVQEPPPAGITAIYARVSSSDQKNDLNRQVSRLLSFANQRGLSVGMTVTEIASGLNGHRPKLIRLLKDKNVRCIVVEYRDQALKAIQDEN